MIENVSSPSNWWRKSGVEAGKLSISPAQLAAEALQDIHSAKSSRLGVTGAAEKRGIKSTSEATEKTTRLWLKRADPWLSVGT